MSPVVEPSGSPTSAVFVGGQSLGHGAMQLLGNLGLPVQEFPELTTTDDVDDDTVAATTVAVRGRLSSRAISP